MTEIMETLAGLSLLVFVIGSMASMGLSLKMNQIIAPLKNVKLVVLALVVNFILVPIVAYVITLILPLDESPGDRLDPVSHGGGCALPAQAGRSCQRQRGFLGGTDGAADGCHHHLPADCAAPAIGWR
jgi:BASS family bile acid:Na+ symporter